MAQATVLTAELLSTIGNDATRRHSSKSRRQVSTDDRWYFENILKGKLEWWLEDAKQRHGGCVQASPFAV